MNILIGVRNVTVESKAASCGTSLVAQWLRLCAPKAGGLCAIPDQGKTTRHN